MATTRTWLAGLLLPLLALAGCRMGASAWIRHVQEPEKHYTLVLTTPQAEYQGDRPIPAQLTLVGIDVPIARANYHGTLTLRMKCGERKSEIELGKMAQLHQPGERSRYTIDLDCREHLPQTDGNELCSAEVRGTFVFYPPDGSQLAPIAEYGSKAKLRSNKIRFVARRSEGGAGRRIRKTAAKNGPRVRHHRSRELFDWSDSDPLENHRDGDVVVMAVSVHDGFVEHFGHRGRIMYPVKGDVGGIGSLVRGRFVVNDADGQKHLTLGEVIDRVPTTRLLTQAFHDYNALLPEIAQTSVPKESRLVLRAVEPTSPGVRIVCPPEGWRTVFVTVRQADLMYVSDTSLRYGFTGKEHHLAECSTVQWFKGE